MYQIVKDGTIFGLIERPTYVQRLPNGAYGLCGEAEATGIAYAGAVYHLDDRPRTGDTETILLIEVDGGELTYAQLQEITATKTATEDAICELDATSDERLTAIEDALCDLDTLLSGGEEDG